MVRSPNRPLLVLSALALAIALLVVAEPASAQARNPFSVGISEGGGAATGLVGWILAQQAAFERLLAVTLRATKTDWRAGWTLVTLSFAYGVFHAAGPGHGKAVVTSYLIANERALRRGLVISLLAALLQGAVAIAIVGVIVAVLQQTAAQMRWTAQLVETASFAGIALLGAWLVWRKGRAFIALLRAAPAMLQPAMAGGGMIQTRTSVGRFVCEPCNDDSADHVHGLDCGHVHMPDPARLGGRRFSLGEAAVTILAAGIRPCSGAILVLVFALSQGLFWVGIGATLAMSLGTAITTGTLAALAVFAKVLALRFTGPASRRGALLARGCELGAAVLVLVLGVLLLVGYVQLS